MVSVFVLFLTLCYTTGGFGARILAYFPVPAPSHHFFFQPILSELGRRGHQVDYYSPFQMRIPQENVSWIQLKNVMPELEVEMALYDHWKHSTLDHVASFHWAEKAASSRICQFQPVRDLLSSNVTYDLLVHEGLFYSDVGNIFQHKFNVASVSIMSVTDYFHVNEFSALVNNPAYMVNAFSVHTDRMGFFERLHNFYMYAMVIFMYYLSISDKQKIVDECYTYPGWETRPPLMELLSDQALVLLNSHHAVGFPYPKAPHHKEIGGAVLTPRKPLPTDIDQFISTAPHGVIYFSFGSLCDISKTLPELNEVFSRVLSRRKERILWKVAGKPDFNVSANAKTFEWLPQQDILAHDNIKLFITHGGLQSSFEAVYFGVPVIGIPCFADQFKNVKALSQAEYGVWMKLDNITESSLDWALQEALKPKYKDRVLKGSELLKDRQTEPVDEAAYWIEYVLRHGKVLQPAGLRLSFIQLHMLDVYAFILIVIFVAMYASKRLASYLWAVNRITAAAKNKVE